MININILCIIANKLDISSIKNFSLCCQLTFDSTYYIRKKIKAVMIIEKWWNYYKLPLGSQMIDHNKQVEYIINMKYENSGITIPNLLNPDNVWIMIKRYDGKYFILFNRDEFNEHMWRGFIIGKTDYDGNFYGLTHDEYLLCLKRYERCIDPETRTIWKKERMNRRRSIIGKVDENFNIHSYHSKKNEEHNMIYK